MHYKDYSDLWEFEGIKHQSVSWKDVVMPRRAGERIVIEAKTYTPDYTIFDVKPGPLRGEDPATYRRYKNWEYRHAVVPRGLSLSIPLLRTENPPRVWFTDDVVIPVINESQRVWMSLTPSEILSQRPGLKFCQGEVVVGGLGLGWFLSEVAKNPRVTKITVVERDADLLDWFGNDLCKRLGVTVVCEDIWMYMRRQKPNTTTRYALDIWRDCFDARDDDNLKQARSNGHKVWAWGSPRGS